MKREYSQKQKSKGHHCLNMWISAEQKSKLDKLPGKSMADTIRRLIEEAIDPHTICA